MQMCNCTINYYDLVKILIAVITILLSYIQLRLYKRKENDKLLSQLNERYLENKDMQAVVKYLRDIDPTDEEPSAYQVELLLRFFEELYVYMRHDGLEPDDVITFFNFYFDRLYHTERGQKLLAKINHEDGNLDYLNGYKDKIGFTNRNIQQYEKQKHTND